jgi:hypothetical protein
MRRRPTWDDVDEARDQARTEAIGDALAAYRCGLDGSEMPYTLLGTGVIQLYVEGSEARRNADRLAEIDAAEGERKRIAEIEDIARRVIATEAPAVEHTPDGDLVVTVQLDPEAVAEIAAIVRAASTS